jgi:hypothetical protein
MRFFEDYPYGSSLWEFNIGYFASKFFLNIPRIFIDRPEISQETENILWMRHESRFMAI